MVAKVQSKKRNQGQSPHCAYLKKAFLRVGTVVDNRIKFLPDGKREISMLFWAVGMGINPLYSIHLFKIE